MAAVPRILLSELIPLSLCPGGRATPFVAKCPSDALQRSSRRGASRLLTRVPHVTGEHFSVAGETSRYTVDICQAPSCSCPDSATTCKHLAFVFLNVLKLAPSNPLWFQTSLLPSELVTLLPHLKGSPFDPASSKRSAPEAAPRPAKRARTGPVSTAGIDPPALRLFLLFAIQEHPEAEEVVSRYRGNMVDALTEVHMRSALVSVASKFDDIGDAVEAKIRAGSSVVLDFCEEVDEAVEILHSLDDLRPSQQYTRSGEVSDGVSEVLSTITSKINVNVSSTSKLNALSAIAEIGLEMFSTDGEIQKALIGCGGSSGDVKAALQAVLKVMDAEDKRKVLDRAVFVELGDLCTDYGIDGIREMWDELKAEVEEED